MKNILASILSIVMVITGVINVRAEEERKPIELSYEIWDNDGPLFDESVIAEPYLQKKGRQFGKDWIFQKIVIWLY